MGRYYFSSSGAINETTGAFTSDATLKALLVHASAAPTTSESFVVTLDSAKGAGYDTVIYSLNLSTGSTTDIAKTDFDLPVQTGDAIDIVFANTDTNAIGVQVIWE